VASDVLLGEALDSYNSLEGLGLPGIDWSRTEMPDEPHKQALVARDEQEVLWDIQGPICF
jgi:hypothetical protein